MYKIMKADEILMAVNMYNRVYDLLKTTKVHNEYCDGDYLFVYCRTNDYYTNSFCDIMKECDGDDYYSLKTIEETAARFVELAIESGADSVNDFYLGY